MKVYPLKCRIRAEGTATRVDVYDDIGADPFWGGGVSAADFASQLAGLKGTLDVHINSSGGNVFDGIAIGEAIRSHKGPVATYVDGIAASIASVIAQAGQERVMAPGSMMMIHEPFGFPGDVNPAESARFTASLEKNAENIAGIYAARAGGSPATWRAAMQDETWYTAEEAIAAGLADRVGGAEAHLPASIDLAAFTPPGRIAAQLRAAAARSAPSAAEGMDAALAEQMRALVREELAIAGVLPGQPKAAAADMHGDHARIDPDNDGDCDACPEGDTDHDYFAADGTQIQALPGQEGVTDRGAAQIRNAVDESAWDASKAMANGAASDDPAAFYAGICAGEKAGDKSTQDAWALPYKYHPGDAPNAAGVRNALSRLPQTEGLTNKAEAQALLERLMKQVNPDYEASENKAPSGFLTLSPDQAENIRAALEETR